jgi:hypothetical protein
VTGGLAAIARCAPTSEDGREGGREDGTLRRGHARGMRVRTHRSGSRGEARGRWVGWGAQRGAQRSACEGLRAVGKALILMILGRARESARQRRSSVAALEGLDVELLHPVQHLRWEMNEHPVRAAHTYLSPCLCKSACAASVYRPPTRGCHRERRAEHAAWRRGQRGWGWMSRHCIHYAPAQRAADGGHRCRGRVSLRATVVQPPGRWLSRS